MWNQVYQESIAPYSQKKISLEEAWDAGVKPIRKFMTLQIERTGNSDDVWLFMSHLPQQPAPQSYDDVPLLGAQEAAVEGGLPRCIRVLVHCYSERSRAEVQHVYLEEARALRADLPE